MAFTNGKGKATIAGTTLYTVPADTSIVIIGFRLVNRDLVNPHTFTATIGGIQVSPADMELVANGGYELNEAAKFVGVTGDAIVVTSDTDNDIDVLVSVLEQPA